jgi:hypothetical protein
MQDRGQDDGDRPVKVNEFPQLLIGEDFLRSPEVTVKGDHLM